MAQFLLIVFLAFIGNIIAQIYGPQPRIGVTNGHMTLTGAHNKNISLITSGIGTVLLNGQDFVQFSKLARNVTDLFNLLGRSVYSYDGSSNIPSGNDGVLSRLVTLETGMKNMTGITTNRLLINRLNRRLNIMHRKIRRLNTLLILNECTSNPCMNGGTCQDLFNSYMCQCPDEWEGSKCNVDVNECTKFAGSDLGCQNGATCVNKPGSFECRCAEGWFGLHCTRRTTDCGSGGIELCGHGICIEQPTGATYKCICDQGWTTDGKNPACIVDVNECTLNTPACSKNPPVECVNIPGSFHCGYCPAGYSGNGHYCIDIDECMIFNGGCSINPMVQCINTPGSRTCGLCPPGYIGNGIVCSYQGGACAINNGGCHLAAQCRDNQRISSTYVECICPFGYVGNGIGPSGCLRSSQTFNPCLPDPCVQGTCLINNSTNDYVCNCRRRYTGRNCDIVKNPCDSSPCLNGGTCRTTIISFTCICTTSYTGRFCQEEKQECGGKLRGLQGFLKYPSTASTRYGSGVSCAWVIQTDPSNVIHIAFNSFNLEHSNDCNYDWLQIHDGKNSAAHMIGRFCGHSLPNGGNISSTANTLYIWFRSDTSVASNGFSLNWTTSLPVCGGKIAVESHGTITSPGYPGNYPTNRDCYWTLTTSFDRRLEFHFFSLMLGNNNNCSDFLKFFSWANMESEPFARYCNESHPAPLVSPTRYVVIYFHSDGSGTYPGFQISYTAVPGVPGCGGTFSQEQGLISPPLTTTRGVIQCEFNIKLSEQLRIKIVFLSLDFESSGSCVSAGRYVALYDGSSKNDPLIGKYCGPKIPSPYISLGNELLIVYKSYNGGSFKIKYEAVCGSQLTDSTGVIHSLNYPAQDFTQHECVYQILQPVGKVITLRIADFRGYYCSSGGFMEVRDGDNENAPLLGKFCAIVPAYIMSTYNYLWIKLHQGNPAGRQFYMNYTTTDRGCGGLLKTKIGSIQSPSHPDSYPSTMNCTWLILAPPDRVILLTWLDFKLEQSFDCIYDYVAVYDNNTENSMGGLMGKFCGSKLPPVMLSSSNMMTVVFKSDNTVNHDGFVASYIFTSADNVCGGTYFTSAGVIKSPHYPKPYPSNRDCVWKIQVPPGRQIMLNVSDFQLESYTGCRYDYLEIRNGGTGASPLIGRYCGTDIPKRVPSHTNQLYLHFKTDMTKHERGFNISWQSTSTGCGGTLSSPKGSIISPHYPEPYSKNTECYWKISLNAGSLVQIIFADIDLEPHIACYLDYVEIFDGIDTSTKSLGKFCSSAHPPYIRSSGNNIFVKFRSDVSFQGRGFQLQYSTVCHNSLTGYNGVIESPNFPNEYPHNQDCLWDIGVPPGNKINITFSHFELERSISYQTQGCNYDFVEIKYYDRENEEMVKYGTYCGDDAPPPMTINSNHTQIHFITDNLLIGNGFRLEWQIEGCSGILTHPDGEISTPNYPHAYPKSMTCEWTIQVAYGSSVMITFETLDLEFSSECLYDFIEIFNGGDDSAPLLIRLCHTENSTIITSTGNKMFVRFQSDMSYEGRGFRANYSTTPTKCGGKLVAMSASFHSPNYPKNYDTGDNCQWLIEIAENHIIELKFNDLDMVKACNNNYIQVHDGPGEGYPVLAKLCGNKLPNETIKSTYNHLFVTMKTGKYLTSKGFSASYVTACGAILRSETSGIITHSETTRTFLPEYECEWTIMAERLDQHVYLTVQYLESTYCDITDTSLKIYNGNDATAPLIGSYCETIPPTIASTGSMLHIKTSCGFRAAYTTFESACGGTLEGEKGFFATPGYPNDYPVNVECEWTLNISSSNNMTLSFANIDIVESDNCNDDFLEIRETNSKGKLIGVFCGKNGPPIITHVGRLWILFKSIQPDVDVPKGKGFIAEYSLNHMSELEGPSGQIISPLYPRYYTKLGQFEWRITVTFGYKILLKVVDIYMELSDDMCFYSYLTIHDGYDANAPEMGTICGTKIPEPYKSTSNVMFIIVSYYINRHGSRFILEWLEVENTKQIEPVAKVQGCGSSEVIDIASMKNYSLVSPGYPSGYSPNLRCEWIFSTAPENHLYIKFLNVNLEYLYGSCLMDRVEVYSGYEGSQNWNLVARACFPNDTYLSTPTTNLMKIVFVTDNYNNQTGFSAVVAEVCGGTIKKSNGMIIVDNSTYNKRQALECQWNVTVRSGRTIRVKFNYFDLGNDNEGKCGNYVMLKNGQYADSPILGNGKYCAGNMPDVLETTGNHLYVKFTAETKVHGFTFEYNEISSTCGGTLQLTEEENSTTISSPNYPNIPLPHTECKWIIMAPPGESLRVDFVKRFDLSETDDCTSEYVELRNGGTDTSPIIDRWCGGDIPSSQHSRDNMIYVKFFTDIDDPKNGFMATVSISTCGGIVRGRTGMIRSPFRDPNRRYPKNVDCTWEIIGPRDHYLKLDFQTLDLDRTACTKNYVEVIEHVAFNATADKQLGRYCGVKPTEVIETSSNKVTVRFRTGERARKPAEFSLSFNTSQEECGGNLENDFGYIESPGYPFMNHLHRNCEWNIKVPKGRRITVEILDLDFDTTVDMYDQGLAFFNGEDFKSQITYVNSGESTYKFINSSDNKMSIYFWSSHPSRHRGFKLKYTSDEPSICMGDFGQSEGSITSPVRAKSYYCSWSRVDLPPPNRTLAIEIYGEHITRLVSQGATCKYASNLLTVSVGDTVENSQLMDICSPLTKPVTVRSPYLKNTIAGIQSRFHGTLNFTASYKTYRCGGILTSSYGSIRSPGFPTKTQEHWECVWLIQLKEEETVTVNFTTMDLGDDCDKSFITIHNGHLKTSPKIGTYCRTNAPQNIHSQSNGLWIEYHTDGYSDGKGFELTYEAVVSGCGGIYHDNTKLIQSPSYPNSYPNNAECVWEVHSQNGYHIGLEFIDRFQLEKSDDCLNDFVQVWDYVDNEWVSKGRICGREHPPFYNSTSNRMKIMFRSNGKTTGSGFKAQWTLNCGGKFVADETLRFIMSPGYPNDYKNYMDCEYSIDGPRYHINIVFEDFELERAYAECHYDNVSISSQYSEFGQPSVKTYCGNSKPQPVTLYSHVTVRFRTDGWITRRGFRFSYRIDSCGGDINKSSEISSPSIARVALPSYYMFRTCSWRITAPADKVVVVRFESFNTIHSVRCNHNNVEIYNGLKPLADNRLALICGNLTEHLPIIQSNGSTMLLKYKQNNVRLAYGFKAVVYFTHGPGDGCGGSLFLQASETKMLEGPRGLSFVDCHWNIETGEGNVIYMELVEKDSCVTNSTQILNVKNCTCSLFEIRDGGGPFSELIDEICDNDTSTTYSTSGTRAWVRWATNGFNTGKGFKLKIKTEPTKCGLLHLMAENTTKYLTSPNYPNAYPDNLKCVWRFQTSNVASKIYLKFEEFDLGLVDDTATSCRDDRVEITDNFNTGVVQEGLGSGTIYSVGKSLPIFGASRIPFGVHQYCGQKATEFHYYSWRNDVVVSFYSGSTNHGKGFRLEYKTIGCDRNFTSSQGRLINERNFGTCTMSIVAPENTTISLYFLSFYFADTTSSCEKMNVKIYDGDTFSSNVLGKYCGFRVPNPIFSTQNKLLLHINNSNAGFAHFDSIFTSTDKGRGCGGEIYNYMGKITSPMYPNDYKKDTECIWEIRVPHGLQSAIKFINFDLRSPCETDYVVVTTYQDGLPNEHRFCKDDTPAVLHSSNRITLTYKSSLNNGGIGWVAQYTSLTSGYTLRW